MISGSFLGCADIGLPPLGIALVVSAAVVFAVHLLIVSLWKRYERRLSMEAQAALTGTCTWDVMLKTGERRIAGRKPFAFFLIDLKSLEEMCLALGAPAVERVLAQAGDIVMEEAGEYKRTTCRTDANRLALLLADASFAEAEAFSARLQKRLEKRWFQTDNEISSVRLSVFIAFCHFAGDTDAAFELMVRQAEKDLNRLIKSGAHPAADAAAIEEEMISDRCRMLLEVLADKDAYTYAHSQSTAEYAVLLGQSLNLPQERLEELNLAGWLHDVGKLKIPQEILAKPSFLTAEEYETVKSHVAESLNMLHGMPLSEGTLYAIKYHHERWDGTGYPYGMAGERTPLEGRILQIADAFSAMTNKRVYRKKMSGSQALQELVSCSGTLYDPRLVKVFVDAFRKIH